MQLELCQVCKTERGDAWVSFTRSLFIAAVRTHQRTGMWNKQSTLLGSALGKHSFKSCSTVGSSLQYFGSPKAVRMFVRVFCILTKRTFYTHNNESTLRLPCQNNMIRLQPLKSRESHPQHTAKPDATAATAGNEAGGAANS